MNMYESLRSRPLIAVDPNGTDVWIEGANENEPLGHQSINIGKPDGPYNSYSYGADGAISASLPVKGGRVYKDVESFGPIDPMSYKETPRWLDRAMVQSLEKAVSDDRKNPKYYTFLRGNCRKFSQETFDTYLTHFGMFMKPAASKRTVPETSSASAKIGSTKNSSTRSTTTTTTSSTTTTTTTTTTAAATGG